MYNVFETQYPSYTTYEREGMKSGKNSKKYADVTKDAITMHI